MNRNEKLIYLLSQRIDRENQQQPQRAKEYRNLEQDINNGKGTPLKINIPSSPLPCMNFQIILSEFSLMMKKYIYSNKFDFHQQEIEVRAELQLIKANLVVSVFGFDVANGREFFTISIPIFLVSGTQNYLDPKIRFIPFTTHHISKIHHLDSTSINNNDNELFLSFLTQVLQFQYKINVKLKRGKNNAGLLLLNQSSPHSSSSSSSSPIEINTFFNTNKLEVGEKYNLSSRLKIEQEQEVPMISKSASFSLFKKKESSSVSTSLMTKSPFSIECLQDLMNQIYSYQQIIMRTVKLTLISNNTSSLFMTCLISEDVLLDLVNGLMVGKTFTNHFRPLFINESKGKYQCLYRQYELYKQELNSPHEQNKDFMYYQELSGVVNNIQTTLINLDQLESNIQSKSSRKLLRNNSSRSNLSSSPSPTTTTSPIINNNNNNKEKLDILFLTPYLTHFSSQLEASGILNNLHSITIEEPSIFSFAPTWTYEKEQDKFLLVNTKITHMETNYTTQCYLEYLSSCIHNQCLFFFKSPVQNHHTNTILSNFLSLSSST